LKQNKLQPKKSSFSFWSSGYSVASAEEDEVENEDEGAVEDEEPETTEEQVTNMNCHQHRTHIYQ